MNWYACPFLRLLLPFMAGIWFAYMVTTGVSLSLTFYFAIVWAILVVLFVLVRFLRNTLYSWVFGVVLNVFLFVFGVTVVEVSSPRNDGSFHGRLLDKTPAEI